MTIEPDFAAAEAIGALVPHGQVRIAGAPAGPLDRPLAGLAFFAKDIFDVAGAPTGASSPAWLASHPVPDRHAPAVAALLDAGATLIGKTVTDEIAYSLIGQNAHYGTPRNVAAPGRVPGGSSSGSAAAVAAGLAPFALGSDTGGSVRVPAALCGLFAIRPSHGRIALDGVMALAPSFDTVGWFAADADLLRRIGTVLLDAGQGRPRLETVLIAKDALALSDDPVAAALRPWLDRLRDSFAASLDVTVAPDGLDRWMEHFRIIQAHEVWRTHGAWVRREKPAFGPGVAERFQMSAGISDDAMAAHARARAAVKARLAVLLADGAMIALPTAPSVAPRTDAGPADLQNFRERTLALTCIAGLAGLPQINLPVARLPQGPVGLSLIARRGADSVLLATAARLADDLGIAVAGLTPAAP